jgi:hypothetical protein
VVAVASTAVEAAAVASTAAAAAADSTAVAVATVVVAADTGKQQLFTGDGWRNRQPFSFGPVFTS